jgi:hypothetical protein
MRSRLRTSMAFIAFSMLAISYPHQRSALGQTNELRASQSRTIKITRKIDANLVRAIEIPPDSVVQIISGGGLSQDFLPLADKIRNAGATLEFPGNCLSACAEYLLTLNVPKRTSESTFVALHQNALIFDYSVKTHLPPEYHNCLNQIANRQRAHLLKSNLNTHFWEKQYQYLDIHSIVPVEGQNCAFAVQFKAKWWIPTSKQLSQELGLNLSGDICNDDLNCIKKRVLKILSPNEQIVIGSDKYRMTDTFGLEMVDGNYEAPR